ncbi:MAG TPA: transporter [Steroidobacteraceae bacterium]|nr:transporter [Steroidobacteraceae bacterium]
MNPAGRRPLHITVSLTAALPLLAALPERSSACASCGCTLSADAAMGYSAMPGWRLSLEYDYINQNQLRSGTHAVAGVPDGTELENQTINQYVSAGLSYSPNSSWNVTLLVPYVIRSHSTYGTFDSTQPLPELSRSFSSSVGDTKLIVSYQGWLPTNNLGLQLGVKLPTGQYGTAVDFYSGPNAGKPLDASLQPGTGSTDLIVGAYYYQAISQNFDAFINGQFQAAVKHRMDQPGNDYRPGNSTTVSFGLRYEGNPRWVPQLQVNLLHKQPDTGALADVQNTAGSVAYLSPGLTAQLSASLHVFAFVQLPVYSNLYGIQLFPRWTGSLGVTYAF